MKHREKSKTHADAASLWANRGQRRPDFALPPGPDQESVWDYPRPPVLRPDTRLVQVEINGQEIARSRNTIRVLETASPPTFYIPPADVLVDLLHSNPSRSHCEWKGFARYWNFENGGESIPSVGWSYPEPTLEFEAIAGWFGFYPSRALCRVDGRPVQAQAGEFYGGWITPEVIGPFKGDPGTGGW